MVKNESLLKNARLEISANGKDNVQSTYPFQKVRSILTLESMDMTLFITRIHKVHIEKYVKLVLKLFLK